MKQLPDDLRARLGALRICRANGIAPRVLVPEQALDWLEHVDVLDGYVEAQDDFPGRAVAFARRLAGTAYDTHATIARAPELFSCSTFVAYAMASVGIDMPRYAIDQSYCGRRVEGPGARVGTLAFWKGEFPIRDPSHAVGHVAMVCGDRRMIHAGGTDKTVHEFTPQRPETAIFVDPFPSDPHVLVHLSPEARGFKTALDVVRSMQR